MLSKRKPRKTKSCKPNITRYQNHSRAYFVLRLLLYHFPHSIKPDQTISATMPQKTRTSIRRSGPTPIPENHSNHAPAPHTHSPDPPHPLGPQPQSEAGRIFDYETHYSHGINYPAAGGAGIPPLATTEEELSWEYWFWKAAAPARWVQLTRVGLDYEHATGQFTRVDGQGYIQIWHTDPRTGETLT